MLKSVLRKSAIIGLSALSLSALSLSAKAVNLVTNGGFETTSAPGTAGQVGLNGFTVDGWTASGSSGSIGYSFLFAPGTADNGIGAPDSFGDTVQLWGSRNGGLDPITTSPDGGNFIASDGEAAVNGPSVISQTINGLTKGETYAVSFYWGGAQQEGQDPVSHVPYDQQTFQQWQVSFGGQTQTTPVLTNPGKGFTAWQKESLIFTADGSSDLLSFLAMGRPDGQPPFLLLDGVSVEVVPEAPVYIGALVALGLGAGLRVKFAKKK